MKVRFLKACIQTLFDLGQLRRGIGCSHRNSSCHRGSSAIISTSIIVGIIAAVEIMTSICVGMIYVEKTIIISGTDPYFFDSCF